MPQSSGKRKDAPKKGEWNNSTRLALCIHASANPKLTQTELKAWLKEEHGCEVSQGTISVTLKKGQAEFPASMGSIKRQRAGTWPDVERALFDWILQYQQTVAITGDMVKLKAGIYFQKMHPDNEESPTWSNGWLGGFQGRFKIKSWKRHGEAGSVQVGTLEEQREALQKELAPEDIQDIYNMDETGLFWKLQPDTGLATVQLAGLKKDKARFTVVGCANMAGTDKLPLWVIGKFEKPRALKGVNRDSLGCIYEHSPKAWMTGNLFIKWLEWFDKHIEVTRPGRKVILLLDNASTHTVGHGLELKAVTLRFLPPNTTSVLQPLDQGIIRSLKAHYRKNYYLEILARMEAEKENREESVKGWDIYDAILTVADAWNLGVTQETIVNCFRHSKVKVTTTAAGHAPVRIEPVESFVPPEDGDYIPPQDDTEAELSSAIDKLGYSNKMSIANLLNHPGEKETEALDLPTDDEIIQNVIAEFTEVQETEEDLVEIGWKPKKQVSSKAALEALRTVEAYARQNSHDFDSSKAGKVRVGVALVRRAAEKHIRDGARQQSILQYFTRA